MDSVRETGRAGASFPIVPLGRRLLLLGGGRAGQATCLALLVAAAAGVLPATARLARAQVPVAEISANDRDALYQAVARDADQFQRQGNLLRRVVRLVKPTVVHIEAGKRTVMQRFSAGPSDRIEEAGSGVVVDLGGKLYVLTNRHVIKGALRKDIKIRLSDGRELLPTRSWSDNLTDVAVLEIDASGIVPARLGDSDQTEIGDFVLAVGSPFGLSHTVTYGIVSAKGRHGLELGEEGVTLQDFIQTDAAINPGNSGGPLINLRGEVIGINTAIASASGGNEGIGFAIPANMVRFIAEQLVENGRVARGFLGVKLDAKFDSATASQLGLARPTGTRITEVTPRSPAEAANLRVGDVILEFDGVRIADDNHLVNVVGRTKTGRKVPVVVFRAGARVDVVVTVATRGDFEPKK